MSINQREQDNVEDETLQAFKAAKDQQMGLFDDSEEEAHPEPVVKEAVTQAVQEDPEEVAESEETVYTGADGVLYTEEEWFAAVVPNGPTRREVEGWKEKYQYVYFTPFANDVYVWRTLMRPEYREIIRETSLTAMDREEMFTEKCTLYPYDFSLDKIKKSRAGVASLLSEMIMEKSGFVAQSAPIRL